MDNNNNHCTKCKYYMNCNYNQIGLGSGNWAKECKDYKEKCPCYKFGKSLNSGMKCSNCGREL